MCLLCQKGQFWKRWKTSSFFYKLRFVRAVSSRLSYNTPAMKTLVLLSAIPGSGKSTWSKRYQEEHPNTYIVSSDEIRTRLYGDAQNFDHEAEVWDTFLHDIHEYGKIDDCTVICDSTNLQNKYRRYYLKSTPEFDIHQLVLFDIPYEICLYQNRKRHKGRIVSDMAMKELFDEFEYPSQEIIDLYDEYIVLTKDSPEDSPHVKEDRKK